MRIVLMTVNSLTVKQKSLKDETWTENRAVIGPSRLKSPTIDLASSGQNLSAATALSHLLEPSCSIILLHCGQRHDYSSTRLARPSVQPCSYRPPLPFSSRCAHRCGKQQYSCVRTQSPVITQDQEAPAMNVASNIQQAVIDMCDMKTLSIVFAAMSCMCTTECQSSDGIQPKLTHVLISICGCNCSGSSCNISSELLYGTYRGSNQLIHLNFKF